MSFLYNYISLASCRSAHIIFFKNSPMLPINILGSFSLYLHEFLMTCRTNHTALNFLRASSTDFSFYIIRSLINGKLLCSRKVIWHFSNLRNLLKECDSDDYSEVVCGHGKVLPFGAKYSFKNIYGTTSYSQNFSDFFVRLHFLSLDLLNKRKWLLILSIDFMLGNNSLKAKCKKTKSVMLLNT